MSLDWCVTTKKKQQQQQHHLISGGSCGKSPAASCVPLANEVGINLINYADKTVVSQTFCMELTTNGSSLGVEQAASLCWVNVSNQGL